jgi:hypothetical protein
MAKNSPSHQNLPKNSQHFPKIANWPAISAASAVEMGLPQLCSSQAEFAAEVSPP